MDHRSEGLLECIHNSSFRFFWLRIWKSNPNWDICNSQCGQCDTSNCHSKLGSSGPEAWCLMAWWFPMDVQTLWNTLVAAVPLLIQPPPLPLVLQMATLGGIINVISHDHERLIGLLNEPEDCARPPQGGQRITVWWLRLIRDVNCRYRFRYLCKDSWF